MSKKTAAQKLWNQTRKKIQVQRNESELLRTSEAVHQFLLEAYNQIPAFDMPDSIYVPWVAAIKKLGGNV